MTVRAQLGLGFGFLLLVMLATGTISIAALHATVANKDVVARDFAEEVSGVERLRLRAEQLVSASRGYLVTGDPQYLHKFLDAKREFSLRIQELLSEKGEPESAYLATIERTSNEYVAATENALQKRSDSGDPRTVVPYFEGVLKPARDAFEAELDSFIRFKRRSFEAAFLDSRRSATQAELLVGISTVVGLLLGLWLALVVFRRLTEQFEREQAAVEVANRAAAAREELLAVVSHDLRNPLGAILMSITLLERMTAPAEKRVQRQIESVRGAAQRMKHLIDDLLDIARVEAGTLALRCDHCDVPSLIDEVAKLFESRASESSIRLSMHIATAERSIWIDRERLLQTLSNLVGNALKFTPNGGDVSLVVDDQDNAVRFLVSDTGPGIPTDAVSHLFERHWQSRRSGREGLGLGLYIAKNIVELHGGRIWVESKPGAGSRFFFTVPHRPSENRPAAESVADLETTKLTATEG